MYGKNHRFITSFSLVLIAVMFAGCSYFDTSGHGLEAKSSDLNMVDTTPVYGEPSMSDVVLRSTNGRVRLYSLDGDYTPEMQAPVAQGYPVAPAQNVVHTPFLDLARSPFATPPPEEPSAVFTRAPVAGNDSSVEIYNLN
jgi:hypothetical protein